MLLYVTLGKKFHDICRNLLFVKGAMGTKLFGGTSNRNPSPRSIGLILKIV